jgi:hypothetical protein
MMEAFLAALFGALLCCNPETRGQPFYKPALTGRKTGDAFEDDNYETQPANGPQATPVEMLRVNESDDLVWVQALKWDYDREVYEDRYKRIKTIGLEGFGLSCPDTPDDVAALLVSLPKGFVHNPDYGLGLAKDYKSIIEAIEEVSDIEHLIISRVRQTTVDANTYILKFSAYDAVRKGINNTHIKSAEHRQEGKEDPGIQQLGPPVES